MLQFQSALLKMAGNTRAIKKPWIVLESEKEIGGDDDEEEDQNGARNEVQIHEEELSYVTHTPEIKRVFHFYYDTMLNETEGDANSPQCDALSDVGSMSMYEPDTVTISVERVGQMIENHAHIFFQGKNPEAAHIKDKPHCTTIEKNDENNFLFMSRFLHEAYDGINTQPSGFPWFLIHYDSHSEQPYGYAALQRQFGESLHVYDRTKQYYRTLVHIVFYDVDQATLYSTFLRDGCSRVDASSPLQLKMELFFSDPVKAKKYFDWKEKRTRKKWDSL
jgi:hypothetical protein